MLKERMNNHRSDIKLHKNTTVGIHFNEILHSYQDFTVTPIEIIENTADRQNKERLWIAQLKTQYPLGLNYIHL